MRITMWAFFFSLYFDMARILFLFYLHIHSIETTKGGHNLTEMEITVFSIHEKKTNDRALHVR